MTNIPCGTRPEPGTTCHICLDTPADLTLEESSYCLPCYTSCAECHLETDGSLRIPGPADLPWLYFHDACFFKLLSEKPSMAAVIASVLGHDVPELDTEDA